MRQVFLNDRPATMEEGVNIATEVQYVIQYGGTTIKDQWDVCPAIDLAKIRDASNSEALIQLQQVVE